MVAMRLSVTTLTKAGVGLLLVMLAGIFAGAAAAQTSVTAGLDLRGDHPQMTRFRRVRRFGWHSGTHYGAYIDARGQHVVGMHTGSHQDWYTIDLQVPDRVDHADREKAGFGEFIVRVNLPGTEGPQGSLGQKTRDLVPDKEAGDAQEQLERQRVALQRDNLLDDADQKFAKGLYREAAMVYQQAMKLDETDAISRFAVAHSLFALGAYNTAGQNVRLALDQFPDWALVPLKLPDFYPNKEVFFGKLAELRKYVAGHPEDADARLLLGYCCYFSGSSAEALLLFGRLAGTPAGDKHAELFINLTQ